MALRAESERKLRVAVIGHTGHGDYGHGLDTMWLRVPETEIVAGPTTELTGKKLALWNVSKDMLMATGAALVVALFLGGPTLPGVALDGALGAVVAFVVFFVKVLLILLLLALLKAALGRLRIDQLMDWGWKVLTPAAVIQIGIVLIAKGVGLL